MSRTARSPQGHPIARRLAEQLAEEHVAKIYDDPGRFLESGRFDELARYYAEKPAEITTTMVTKLEAGLSKEKTAVLQDLLSTLEADGYARAEAGFVLGFTFGLRLAGGAR